MRLSRLREQLPRSAALLAALALSGCAHLGSADPATVVHERAQTRWNALVAGKLDQAYAFTPPSYRAVTPFETYRATFGAGAAWLGADVLDVRCEPERCEVPVRLRIQLPVRSIGPVTTDTKEVWIQENGQWWLYQKN